MPAEVAADPEPALRRRSLFADPKRPWSGRVDGAIAAALALAVVVLRLPLRSRYLNGWDAGSFALAVEEYDVLAQRPHAPGYPVYIAAAKMIDPLFDDVNTTLVMLSILFSAAAIAAFYGIAREFASARAAAVAAVLLTLTPFFVFNGVIALSYASEALASAGIAWIAWRLRGRPDIRMAVGLGAAWALGVGLRPSVAMFLAPLVAYALWPSHKDWRGAAKRAAAAAAASAATGLTWAIPMFLSTSHGFEGWRRAMRIQSEWVVFAEGAWASGIAGIVDRNERLAFFLQAEARYLLGALALAALVCVAATRSRPRLVRTYRAEARFLAAWLLPVVSFYLLVFDGWDKGPTGYVLVILPALYCIVALGLDAILGHVAMRPVGPRAAKWTNAAVVALVLLPGVAYWNDSSDWLEREVVAHDKWADEWAGLPQRFPPNETAILTFYSWSHVKWYFPDYLVWGYFPIPRNQQPPQWELFLQTQQHKDDVLYYEAHERGPEQPEHPVPGWVKTIVVFDFQLAGEGGEPRRLRPEVEVTEEHLPSGMRLLAFRPNAEHPTIESYFQGPG